MKGIIRDKVSLMIGNSLFRKRRTVNGSVFFSCNTCETSYNTHLSAIAKIKEDGAYELIEWPRSRDHACWSDGNQALIRQARTEMFTKITENPSRSILQIYKEVRNSITHYPWTPKKSCCFSPSSQIQILQTNSIFLV